MPPPTLFRLLPLSHIRRSPRAGDKSPSFFTYYSNRTPSLTNCSSQLLLHSPAVSLNSSTKIPKTPRKSSRSRDRRERRNSDGKLILEEPVLRSPYTKVSPLLNSFGYCLCNRSCLGSCLLRGISANSLSLSDYHLPQRVREGESIGLLLTRSTMA